MKAVFTHKVHSAYDDLPEERYHFPRAYLRQVEATMGDHIVYYEPGRTGPGDGNRTGRRSYVATARVVDVRPDQRSGEQFYALIDPSTFLTFDRPVPFSEGGTYYEGQLRRSDGATSKGAFGRAVRPLTEAEFERIVAAGFAQELTSHDALAGAARAPLDAPGLDTAGLAEPAAGFARPILERLQARPVRDAAFARAVQAAYRQTCAMTGLRIVNGGGRAEVEAAHIKPVHDSGPDSIRNGIALSRTMHWLFDRGLVAIGRPPDYKLMIGTKAGLPEAARRLLRPDGRLIVPDAVAFRPAESYLDHHRRHIFKG